MKKRIICAFLAIVMIIGCVGILSACGETEEPGPTTETCKHVDSKESNDGKCDKCGEPYVRKHSTHNDADGDGKCDVGGCTKKPTSNGGGGEGGEGDGGEEEEELDIYWEPVDLIYQMTAHDTSELSSTCLRYLEGISDRYLAGTWTEKPDDLDKAIDKRNKEALDFANINSITYLYRPNTEEYGWGHVAEHIIKDKKNILTEGLPDIYCDQTYGMVTASLQNCFANLYGGATRGTSYFPFAKFKELYYAGNFDEDKQGQGYMYEYMTTLTLSKNKMYLLASDYYTDLVRAFFVTPVNVKLLEDYGMDITGDLVGGDNKFTLEDFYQDVYNKNWTYERLIEYSAAVYQDNGNAGKDMSDRFGFVISYQGGLSPSGAIYTTNCTIIERKLNEAINDFEYSYPQGNEKLFDLFDAISDLVNSTGVYAAGSGDDKKIDASGDMLRGIAKQFSEEMILFGGICLLGGLENEEYQGMKQDGGFGVVPVPIYSKEAVAAGDNYLTQIHNEGRIGAIAYKTSKFEMCSAYLHYQSTNSKKILEDYYKYKLVLGAVGASTGTVDMLSFIRNRVRSAFDKTFEDAMGAYYQKSEQRWHNILLSNRYDIDLRGKYEEYYSSKQGDLNNLLVYYEGLED